MDVATVVKTLLKLPAQEQAIGQVFNLGSDEDINIYELAKKIIAITGSSSRIRRMSYEQAYGVGFEDLLRRRPSLEKIRKLTDYQPGRSLDEIIARTVRYFKGD